MAAAASQPDSHCFYLFFFTYFISNRGRFQKTLNRLSITVNITFCFISCYSYIAYCCMVVLSLGDMVLFIVWAHERRVKYIYWWLVIGNPPAVGNCSVLRWHTVYKMTGHVEWQRFTSAQCDIFRVTALIEMVHTDLNSQKRTLSCGIYGKCHETAPTASGPVISFSCTACVIHHEQDSV